MPEAEFPTSLAGWALVLVSSFVGFFASFLFIKLARKVMG